MAIRIMAGVTAAVYAFYLLPQRIADGNYIQIAIGLLVVLFLIRVAMRHR